MISERAGMKIDPATVQSFDPSSPNVFKLSEAPDGLFEQILEASRSLLELKYTEMPSTAGNPTYEPYASVVVNGKVVAEIDNHGFVKSANASGGRIRSLVEGAEEIAGCDDGPALAQARAALIAAAFGGKVVKASTAMTDADYAATPQPKGIVDTAAMQRDPAYAEIQALMAARSEFLAQQIGQSDDA